MRSLIQANKLWAFFVKDGWLTKSGDRLLTVASLLLIFVPFWLVYEDRLGAWVGLILIVLGSVLGAVVGYEGKAKQFGFQAPFTNDPLGWRKAKKTYAESDEPKPDEDKRT